MLLHLTRMPSGTLLGEVLPTCKKTRQILDMLERLHIWDGLLWVHLNYFMTPIGFIIYIKHKQSLLEITEK